MNQNQRNRPGIGAEERAGLEEWIRSRHGGTNGTWRIDLKPGIEESKGSGGTDPEQGTKERTESEELAETEHGGKPGAEESEELL